MKNVGSCPKCNSKAILRVSGNRQGYGSGNNLQLGLFSQILVAKYVCCDCGFIEDWVDNPYDMVKIRDQYAKRERQQQNHSSPTVSVTKRSSVIR
jgi:hypothetical protein